MDVRSDTETGLATLDDLARTAYAEGRLEEALQHWEHRHERALAAGDLAAAAESATNIAVYLMMDTGLMAPVRGWVTIAARLLAELDESPVHAWLAMVRTYERFMCGDMVGARAWADRAVEIGTRHGAAAPAAVGRLAVGRVLIFDGLVDEGLAMLDEAAVALLSGHLDPLSVGIVYCELICAMQGLAQYDRAAEWTDAMERWRGGVAYGGINGRCRVHRAEILRLRGSCDDAEIEAVKACEELRPWMRREYGWPLAELGTIRLRKGDLAGAEQALLASHHNGWDPHPSLALLRLAQGDVDAARALIDDALAHPLLVPSKERPPHVSLTKAPLLEARVEIAVAAGDVEAAETSATELSAIAVEFQSAGLRAAAALARARVALARADAEMALTESEAACVSWHDMGAPYEGAVARAVLGRAHRLAGHEARARLELEAAREAFERISARGKAVETAALLDGAPGPPSGCATSHRSPTGRPRFGLDGDTRTVEFDGKVVLLRDLKGMRYLARMLAEPGREFHVLDLVAVDVPGAEQRLGRGITTPLLDAKAKDALRRRLRDIDDDIDEAVALGDEARAALAEADRDYIVQELSRAFGLGGRSRDPSSDAERARASVTRSLRYALARIADHHPRLATHLDHAVRTGAYCAYAPDPRAAMTWDVW